eukprot:TRINITY_DN920_c0_g1_i1.p1 TRINITY_DN920_c0_g1~~TRINITY_DN920_c0_g1_i1.p1  ORF type:complete len:143 (-),score=20.94 TRINITY_DN920_c0_g1_i1:94-522(-)
MDAASQQKEERHALIDGCSRGGTDFLKTFYQIYDINRQMLTKAFREETVFIFNGNQVATQRESLSQFFNTLPATVHDVKTFDCQPVITGTGNPTLLISAAGTIKFGEKKPVAFTENFVLVNDPQFQGNRYFLANNVFRCERM